MERNLRLLPAYKAARDALFWLPVFFLYFSSKVSVAEVLILEAIYYGGVVALEVPSGYFSDRIGRRLTLVLAAGCGLAANVTFVLADGFVALAAGQLALAAAMAFNSGTDSAMLYDSLEELERASEFERAMARMQSLAFVSTAAAALVGGLSASIDLRLAYAASALAAAVSLVCALAMAEPPRAVAEPPLSQLRSVVSRMRRPRLGWVFAFTVGMTIFNHVPYELVQPYVRLVLEPMRQAGSLTPIVTGAAASVTLVVASLASRRAVWMRDRMGLTAVLLGMALLQGTIIAGIATVVHVAVFALVVLRSVPAAVCTPLVDGTVHPELGAGMRATYLSVQSLAGRLAFAASLLVASWGVGSVDRLDAMELQQVGLGFLAALVVFVLVLVLRSGAMRSPVD